MLQAGNEAGNLRKPGCAAGERGAELWHGPEQAARIGMPRRAKELGDGSLFEFAAGIHHHHALGDLRHDAKVVGDEDDSGADAVLEIPHQVEDLRLDGHVQCRGRFVGDQQLRIACKRHGDHHALPHATRKLMRIFAQPPARLRDADKGEHLDRTRLRRLPVKALMQAQRLAELAADGKHGVKARHRLLEDHADLVAANAAHLALGKFQEVLALEADRACDLCRRFWNEPQNRHGGHGFPTTALADHGKRLAFVHMKRNAVDGAINAILRAEMRLQLFDLEQGHITIRWPCVGRAHRAICRRAD